MIKLNLSAARALLLALTATAASSTLAEECPPSGGLCEAPSYNATYITGAGGDKCSATACLSAATPPAPVLVNCTYGNRNFICEAQPQGVYGEFRYTWTLQYGRLSFPGASDPYSPLRSINCGATPSSDKLTVAVWAPNGLYAKASVTLDCP